GIILAAAGIKRLGYEQRITQVFNDDIMVPAVGQGALGIVCRSDDASTRRVIRFLDHKPTRTAVTAERGLLRALGGSCQIPVAGRAALQGNRLTIKGLVGSLDGTRIIADELSGAEDRPSELGLELGHKLLSMGAAEILAEIERYGAGR